MLSAKSEESYNQACAQDDSTSYQCVPTFAKVMMGITSMWCLPQAYNYNFYFDSWVFKNQNTNKDMLVLCFLVSDSSSTINVSNTLSDSSSLILGYCSLGPMSDELWGLGS